MLILFVMILLVRYRQLSLPAYRMNGQVILRLRGVPHRSGNRRDRLTPQRYQNGDNVARAGKPWTFPILTLHNVTVRQLIVKQLPTDSTMSYLCATNRLGRVIILAIAFAIGSAFADNSKISPDLLPLLSNPSNTVNVIVQYSSPPQTCTINILGLGGVVCTVVNLLGGVVKVVFTLINAVAGILHPGDIINLSNQSNVTYISLDRTVTGMLDYTTTAGNGASSSGPGSFRNLKGMAPNANLLDLRVLDQNGASNDSAVIAAIEKAVKLKSQYNVRVINLSLGRRIFESCTRDPLCQAVEAAWNSGIVVVTAAGNLGRNGYATILSPGNSPHAITVGAMKTLSTYSRTDDLITSYSSKGPSFIDWTVKPDVVAPGNQVVSLEAPGSTLVSAAPGNVVYSSYYTSSASAGGGGYLRLSGTSMATPVVSGAVALMLQKNPSLSPDTVKARLMKTATKAFPLSSVTIDPVTGTPYFSTYDMFTVGAGYLDIAGALNNTDVAQKSAASPTAS